LPHAVCESGSCGGRGGRRHSDIGGPGADPNICVVPAGGGVARLVTDVGSQDHPEWSPDGRLIAYTWGLELGPDDIRVVAGNR
jgi:Tol biopolymer transport system component